MTEQKPELDPGSRWLGIVEIAAELRISRMSVYRLVSTGELSGVRVGRTIRIRRVDYDTYIARNIITPKETP